MKKVLSILLVFSIQTTFAQEDFDELSARERIEIADRERIESKNDAGFQELMQKGHEMFEGKHYLKAIRAYEKASEKRPYNVYPKVIIADIELSMKDTLAILRQAEKEELSKKNQERKKELEKPEKPEQDETEEKPDDPMKRLNEWEEKERAKREAQRRRAEEDDRETPAPSPEMSGDVKKLSMDDYRKELGEKYPTGITETITEEGNKVITTRVVVRDGKGDRYKKVVHNWGGVFYFKNGDAVTERVWNQETTKR